MYTTREWAGDLSTCRGELVPLDIGTEGWAWRYYGVDDVVLVYAPRYFLFGGAMDSDQVEPMPAYQALLGPMSATLANIDGT